MTHAWETTSNGRDLHPITTPDPVPPITPEQMQAACRVLAGQAGGGTDELREALRAGRSQWHHPAEMPWPCLRWAPNASRTRVHLVADGYSSSGRGAACEKSMSLLDEEPNDLPHCKKCVRRMADDGRSYDRNCEACQRGDGVKEHACTSDDDRTSS